MRDGRRRYRSSVSQFGALCDLAAARTHSCAARWQPGLPADPRDPHAAPLCRVMMIVAQEQAEEVQKREARREAARRQQAQAALEHSKLRQLRANRLAGLKVSPPSAP